MTHYNKNVRYVTTDTTYNSYLVDITDKYVKIYKKKDKYETLNIEDDDLTKYTILVTKYKPEKVFVGMDSRNFPLLENIGNTILLYLGQGKYINIDHQSICEFKIDDIIIKYLSPLDRNGDPRQYAIGKKNVYFLRFGYIISKKVYDKYIDQNDKESIFYFYFDNIPNPKFKDDLKKIDMNCIDFIDRHLACK